MASTTPLSQDELKRRLVAARTLRGLQQTDLDRLGADDGYGKGEMSRVERGELEFRTKHIEPLCRYLDVPRWWFTAGELVLPDDLPPSVEQRLAAVEALLEAMARTTGLGAARFPSRDDELERRMQGDPPASSDQQPAQIQEARGARRGNGG